MLRFFAAFFALCVMVLLSAAAPGMRTASAQEVPSTQETPSEQKPKIDAPEVGPPVLDPPTLDPNDFMREQLAVMLESVTGLDVSVGEADGTVFGDLSAKNIIFKDSKGEVARIGSLAAAWKSSALLRRRLEITKLELSNAVFLRRSSDANVRSPELGNAVGPRPEGNQASRKLFGFSIPRLPVTVSVRSAKLNNISIAQPVIDHAIKFSADLDLELPRTSEPIDLAFNLRRNDDKPGNARATLRWLPETDQLVLGASVKESADGLAAKLVGLPTTDPIALVVEGQGTLSDWRGQLSFLLENQFEVVGTANIRQVGAQSEKRRVTQVTGRARFFEQFQSRFPNLLDQAIEFAVEIDTRSNVEARLKRGVVQSSIGKLEFNGDIGLEDLQSDLQVSYDLNDAAPLADLIDLRIEGNAKGTLSLRSLDTGALIDLDTEIENFSGFGARMGSLGGKAQVNLGGGLRNWDTAEISAKASFLDLSYEDTNVDAGSFDASLSIPSGGATDWKDLFVDADFQARGIDQPQLLTRRISTPVKGRIQGRYNRPSAQLFADDITIDSAELNFDGSAVVDSDDVQGAEVNGQYDVADLSLIKANFGPLASGGASGEIDVLDGRAELTANLKNSTWKNQQIAKVVGSDATLSATVNLRNNQLSDTQLSNDNLNFAGSLKAGETTQIDGDIEVKDLSKLPGLEQFIERGTFDGTLDFSRTKNIIRVTVDGTVVGGAFKVKALNSVVAAKSQIDGDVLVDLTKKTVDFDQFNLRNIDAVVTLNGRYGYGQGVASSLNVTLRAGNVNKLISAQLPVEGFDGNIVLSGARPQQKLVIQGNVWGVSIGQGAQNSVKIPSRMNIDLKGMLLGEEVTIDQFTALFGSDRIEGQFQPAWTSKQAGQIPPIKGKLSVGEVTALLPPLKNIVSGSADVEYSTRLTGGTLGTTSGTVRLNDPVFPGSFSFKMVPYELEQSYAAALTDIDLGGFEGAASFSFGARAVLDDLRIKAKRLDLAWLSSKLHQREWFQNIKVTGNFIGDASLVKRQVRVEGVATAFSVHQNDRIVFAAPKADIATAIDLADEVFTRGTGQAFKSEWLENIQAEATIEHPKFSDFENKDATQTDASSAWQRAKISVQGKIRNARVQLVATGEGKRQLEALAQADVQSNHIRLLFEELKYKQVALDLSLIDQAILDMRPATQANQSRWTFGTSPLRLRVNGFGIAGSARYQAGQLDVRLTSQGTEIAPLLEDSQFHAETGSLDADLHIFGPLDKLKGTGQIEVTDLHLFQRDANGQVGLGELPPLNIKGDLQILNQRLFLQGSASGGTGLDAKIDLSVPLNISAQPFKLGLSQSESLGGQINGVVDLAQAASFLAFEEDILAGQLRFNADIGGTIPRPLYSGRFEIFDGRYENSTLGLTLAPLFIIGEVQGDRLRFQSKAPSPLQLSGNILLSADHNFPITTKIVARRADVVDRDEAAMLLSADLLLSGELTKSTLLTGEVVVEDAEVRFPESDGVSIATLNVTEINRPTHLPPVVRRQPRDVTLLTDFTVRSANDIIFRGGGIDSKWQANLRVTGPANNPRILGTIDATRGELILLGRQFDLSRGRLQFNQDEISNPSIDMVAEHQTSDLLVRIAVEGTFSAPNVSVSSLPEQKTDEILSRLLFNRSLDQIDGVEALELVSALSQLQNLGREDALVERIRSFVGLDTLTFAAQEDGETRLRAGRRLREDVLVYFEQGLDSDSSRVGAEFDLTPQLKLEGDFGLDAEGKIRLNWSREYD